MIKIAFATDGIFPLSIGGIQRHSALLIPALSVYKDLEIHVIHPHTETLFNHPNIVEHKITQIDFTKNYLRECYSYSGRVEEEIKNISPDIIYAQGLTVWKNAKRYQNKLINNPHGLESFQAIGFKEKIIGEVFKRVQRKIFKASRYIASEGGHLTTILEKNGFKEKIKFLPNAVDLPYEKKITYQECDDPVKVFFMGRFVKNKGIHVLFDCVEKLNSKYGEDKFEFILGGKGPLWEHYRLNNPHKNVTLTGFLSDAELKEHYLQNDIFLLPTLYEGMPTVVLEAMSYGMPVIVSDVGGTPELITKDNGYLVKRNDASQICDALTHYAGLTAAQKKQMGLNARLKVENGFTWPILAEMHYKLFKAID